MAKNTWLMVAAALVFTGSAVIAKSLLTTPEQVQAASAALTENSSDSMSVAPTNTAPVQATPVAIGPAAAVVKPRTVTKVKEPVRVVTVVRGDEVKMVKYETP